MRIETNVNCHKLDVAGLVTLDAFVSASDPYQIRSDQYAASMSGFAMIISDTTLPSHVDPLTLKAL